MSPLELAAEAAAPTTSLPREHYLSPEWFERDMRAVFGRRWLFAGHVSQIPEPGDYVVRDVGHESIIVARGDEGEIVAFHNVCRHRGSRICTAPAGNTGRRFVCPYHGWSYGLDGALRSATRMPADFDTSRWPLKRVAVELWNGLLFLNLSPTPPQTVAERLASVDLAAYDLARTKVVMEKTYRFAANWKTVSENFNECYHCMINHPGLCRAINPTLDLDTFEEEAGWDGTDDFMMFSPSLKSAMRQGYVTMTSDGSYAVRRLLGDPAAPPTEVAQLGWFPNFRLIVSPDFARILTWWPVAPTETLFRASWLVHEDAVEGEDYDVQRVTELLDVTIEEDVVVCERAQLGLTSSGYEPGPYHPSFETALRGFMRAYHAAIGNAPD